MDLSEIFDTQSWLASRGISYQTTGQDVGSGWIGVCCPFCDNDPAFHLGINLSNPRFTRNYIHCWRCGKKGNITHLIKEKEKCSWSAINAILEKYKDRTLIHLRTEDKFQRKTESDHILPSDARKVFLPVHMNYLYSRRYDPDIVVPKYDLYACPQYGDHKYRIIVPVYMEHKIMTYVGIDTTKKLNERYKAASHEKSILFSKECIYGIDSCGDVGIVVEGILDQWRIGDGAIATFGVEYTKAQIRILIWKLKRAFVMYDAGAEEQADKLAWDLAVFMPKNKVEVLQLKQGDPDDLSDSDVRWIRKEVFGR